MTRTYYRSIVVVLLSYMLCMNIMFGETYASAQRYIEHLKQPQKKKLLSYAVMASHAYGNQRSTEDMDGFRRMGDWEAILRHNTVDETTINRIKKTGFSATCFAKGRSGQNGHQIVIAFRGTQPVKLTQASKDIAEIYIAKKMHIPRYEQYSLPVEESWADLTTDGVAYFGRDAGQLKAGINFAEIIRKQYPRARISVTGHSLGGSIANIIGNRMGWDTYTFNAPRKLWRNSHAYIEGTTKEQINIWTIGDRVSDPERFFSKGTPAFPGKTIAIDPKGKPAHAIATVIEILKSHKPQEKTKDVVLRPQKHNMPAINDGTKGHDNAFRTLDKSWGGVTETGTGYFDNNSTASDTAREFDEDINEAARDFERGVNEAARDFQRGVNEAASEWR